MSKEGEGREKKIPVKGEQEQEHDEADRTRVREQVKEFHDEERSGNWEQGEGKRLIYFLFHFRAVALAKEIIGKGTYKGNLREGEM